MNKTLIIATLVRIAGWIFLFCIAWKFALAFYLIMMGDKMERNLFDQTNLNTIGNILSSLGFLIKRENPMDENGKIKNN